MWGIIRFRNNVEHKKKSKVKKGKGVKVSYQEIADIMEISVREVVRIEKRALRKLRYLLIKKRTEKDK